VNRIANGSVGIAIFVLSLASGPVLAQQPAPPAPSQPGTPTQPLPPGVPAQPEQPGGPQQPPAPGTQEAPPVTERPPAQPEQDRGSAAGVVPEDLLSAEQATFTRPPTFLGPNLFNPPVPRGWITFTPTFTLSGEYDDNIHNSSNDKQSDFIIGLTPGFTLSMQRPEYRLLAGYQMTSEIFTKDSDESQFAGRHDFFADGFYLLSPRTRLYLRERLVFRRDADTSDVSTGGESAAGEDSSFRNTATLGVEHRLTELTTLRASLSQTHFQTTSVDPDARDSDTFRLLVGADYQFTPRLTGTADFESSYFTVQGESDAYTQRPRLGFDYRFTPTLTAGLSAGPSFVFRDDETDVMPAISARLTQLFKFGSLRFGYDRSVTTSTFGLVDRHTVYATLAMSQLVRGLLFEVSPRYTRSNEGNQNNNGTSNTDDKTDVASLTLRATYQLTTSLALIGSYTFRYQKESNGRTEDFDQNRVFLGVQYAFPITVY
jgi:opacity protein-like surface antigen